MSKLESISTDTFINVFNQSTSISDIIKKLSIPSNGSSCRYVSNMINTLNLDVNILKQNYKNEYKQIKICPVCNKEFLVPKKGRLSKKITCSYACANTYFRSGINNGMYNKTYKLELEGGDTNNYRTKCFMYNQHKCCVCGEDKIVAVHHFDGDHTNNEISNLIPLCPTHHVYVHSKYKHLIEDDINNFRLNLIKI